MPLPLRPGDTGPMVKNMQTALIGKGFSVGSAGANGIFGDDTPTGLEAFQDDNALPVQPLCDQQCWTALGLPLP
jgi:peptidoglycan hydrolase-like protein with peptidoglycan-binding domain